MLLVSHNTNLFSYRSVMKNTSRSIFAVALRIQIKHFSRVVKFPTEFSAREQEKKQNSKLLFRSSSLKLKRQLNDTYFAGGSALILQMISTFSSFAAPTRTTLSVAQIGASGNGECRRKENFLLFVFTLIIKCQQKSVVIKIMNGMNEEGKINIL